MFSPSRIAPSKVVNLMPNSQFRKRDRSSKPMYSDKSDILTTVIEIPSVFGVTFGVL